MIDWTNGALNARSWVMKMLIDGLGNDDKHVLETNVSIVAKPVHGRKNCKPLTQVVDQDMAGGDLCEFNMSATPSHAACGEACCKDPRCERFTTIQRDPPWKFVGGGVCHGTPSSCLPGCSTISQTTTFSLLRREYFLSLLVTVLILLLLPLA